MICYDRNIQIRTKHIVPLGGSAMPSDKPLYLDMETEKFDASGIAIDLYLSLIHIL